MTRSELQQFSELRLADAQVLLDGQRWAAAYYLLGYTVECALKACVARRFVAEDVPDKSLVNDFYTHRLDRLLKLSELDGMLDQKIPSDPDFRAKWKIVRDWNETARYSSAITEGRARELMKAVSDPTSGVLQWLRTFY